MPPMPEAGDQRGDVDAEIVEDHDDGDREQGDADQHPDDGHRIADGGFRRVLAGLAADHAEDQLARPDRALEREGDCEEDVEQPLDLERNRGIGRDHVERGGDHEEMVVLCEHPPDDSAPVPAIRIAGEPATLPAQRSASMTRTMRRGDAQARSAARPHWLGTSRRGTGAFASAADGFRRVAADHHRAVIAAQQPRNQAAAGLPWQAALRLAPPLARRARGIRAARLRRSTGACGRAAAPCRRAGRARRPSPPRAAPGWT